MDEPRTCDCGFQLGDPAIEQEPEYTLWGWVLLTMFGITPRPDYISFRCTLCRKEIGQTRDPALLKRRGPVSPSTPVTQADEPVSRRR